MTVMGVVIFCSKVCRERERPTGVGILVFGASGDEKMMFDDDRLYLAGDPALLVLGHPSTLAHWRSEGRGPAFIKLGRRVAYRGRDVNEWLAAHTVRPTDEPSARS